MNARNLQIRAYCWEIIIYFFLFDLIYCYLSARDLLIFTCLCFSLQRLVLNFMFLWILSDTISLIFQWDISAATSISTFYLSKY